MVSDLEHAAASWQWALDAAHRALEADRFLLPPASVSREAHHLADERRATAALLEREVRGDGPWIAQGPVYPTMLGLPAGTRACVLDLDGVLTDSDVLHAHAWAEAIDPVLATAASPDRPFAPFDPDSDYHAYFEGRPRLEGMLLFLAGRGLRLTEAELDEILRRKAARVARGVHAASVTARRGTHRWLRAAGLARIGRAVVSASTATRPMLDRAGLSPLVDAIVDAETIRGIGLRSRPAPDVLLVACGELGVDPARTVALTNSGAGVVGASAAGMPAIGIAAGDEADFLRAYGPARVVESLDLLLDPRLRAA